MKFKITYIIQELQYQCWEVIFIFDDPLEALQKFEQITDEYPNNQFRYMENEEII